MIATMVLMVVYLVVFFYFDSLLWHQHMIFFESSGYSASQQKILSKAMGNSLAGDYLMNNYSLHTHSLFPLDHFHSLTPKMI